MQFSDLPTLNVVLNLTSAILLTFGFINIKKGNEERHKKFMVAALCSTATFLVSYLIYHFEVRSVPYPFHDWTRTVYFIILIPHVILAAVQLPFIIYIVTQAFKENFEKHKRVAKYIWFVWMYVSITGMLVYYMLYIFPKFR